MATRTLIKSIPRRAARKVKVNKAIYMRSLGSAAMRNNYTSM